MFVQLGGGAASSLAPWLGKGVDGKGAGGFPGRSLVGSLPLSGVLGDGGVRTIPLRQFLQQFVSEIGPSTDEIPQHSADADAAPGVRGTLNTIACST